MSFDNQGVSAILLFGSRARGDNSRGSDTDLLLISPPGQPHHKSIGHLSMFFYPWEKLISDACNGDLFVCHIVHEAKPVFDPFNQLKKLQANFSLRSNYTQEISHALDLGWFLDRHANTLNEQVVMKRMVWCARTVLIARFAEQNTPAFAPSILAASAPHAAKILATRHRLKLSSARRKQFREFLIEESELPPLPENATLEDYAKMFARTGNKVGLQTMSRGTHKEIGYQ